MDIPDPEVVSARAEEALAWVEQHPGHTTEELMDWYRSKGTPDG